MNVMGFFFFHPSVEVKVSEKKKLNEKIKERENKQKKQQEELRKRVSEISDFVSLKMIAFLSALS